MTRNIMMALIAALMLGACTHTQETEQATPSHRLRDYHYEHVAEQDISYEEAKAILEQNLGLGVPLSQIYIAYKSWPRDTSKKPRLHITFGTRPVTLADEICMHTSFKFHKTVGDDTGRYTLDRENQYMYRKGDCGNVMRRYIFDTGYSEVEEPLTWMQDLKGFFQNSDALPCYFESMDEPDCTFARRVLKASDFKNVDFIRACEEHECGEGQRKGFCFTADAPVREVFYKDSPEPSSKGNEDMSEVRTFFICAADLGDRNYVLTWWRLI